MRTVLDTSIALNLCWLQRKELLFAIYTEVLAPGEVKREFERKVATDLRFAGLRFPKAITVVEPISIPPFLLANRNLDPGEIAALALALERGIPEVLLDERAGRRVGAALGLHVSGLLGILIEGRTRKLLPELRPMLDQLATGARFWMSAELRDRVLRSVGE